MRLFGSHLSHAYNDITDRNTLIRRANSVFANLFIFTVLGLFRWHCERLPNDSTLVKGDKQVTWLVFGSDILFVVNYEVFFGVFLTLWR